MKSKKKIRKIKNKSKKKYKKKLIEYQLFYKILKKEINKKLKNNKKTKYKGKKYKNKKYSKKVIQKGGEGVDGSSSISETESQTSSSAQNVNSDGGSTSSNRAGVIMDATQTGLAGATALGSSLVRYLSPSRTITEADAKKLAGRSMRSATKAIETGSAEFLSQKIAKGIASFVSPCLSKTPSFWSNVMGLGCSLLEGVGVTLIENGVSGETTGSHASHDFERQAHIGSA